MPLTGCQLCIAPRYLFPYSFGQGALLSEEGDADDDDGAQLPGLPWVFDAATEELQHLLADLQGNVATATDLLLDAQNLSASTISSDHILTFVHT